LGQIVLKIMGSADPLLNSLGGGNPSSGTPLIYRFDQGCLRKITNFLTSFLTKRLVFMHGIFFTISGNKMREKAWKDVYMKKGWNAAYSIWYLAWILLILWKPFLYIDVVTFMRHYWEIRRLFDVHCVSSLTNMILSQLQNCFNG
jgi:hypothetical protein